MLVVFTIVIIIIIAVRYLVDQKWLKQWKKHTGFDSWDQQMAGVASSNPGPVDNSNLFKGIHNLLYYK